MIYRLLRVAALVLLLGSASVSRAQGSVSERLEAYMDAQVRLYGFSGAVLVKRGDQILLRRAYGLADVEWGVPNTMDTKFRIASTSKAFTAVAIMKLVELGRLSLDDTLEQFLPGFPRGDRITIRMLLGHTSGLPTGHDGDVAIDMTMTHERALPILRAKPLSFEPGTEMRYSNTGYLLLSYIIEKVSGVPFDEFLQDHVYGPADLTNTGTYDPTRIITGIARHYRRPTNIAGGEIENAIFANYAMFQGHGGLYSTVDDLARFFEMLCSGRIVSQSSIDVMMTPLVANGRFGLGLMPTPMAGHRVCGHGGDYNGARSRPWVFPDDGLTLVVLSNNDSDAGGISQALGYLTLGQDVEQPRHRVRAQIDLMALESYAGTYEGIAVTWRDGKLMIGDTELVPESQTEFFDENDPNHTYEFLLGPDGRARAIVHGRYGVKRTIARAETRS